MATNPLLQAIIAKVNGAPSPAPQSAAPMSENTPTPPQSGNALPAPSGSVPLYNGPVNRSGILGFLQNLGRNIGMVPGQAQRQMMDIQGQQQDAAARIMLQAQIAQQQAQQRQAQLAEDTRHNQATEATANENAGTEQERATQEGQFQSGELQSAQTRNQIAEQQSQNELQLGQQRNALDAKRIAADNSIRMEQLKQNMALRQQILGLREGTTAQKVYQPALDADDRLLTMRQNLDDGLHGNQQAMLSLLSNHLGMTMGLQKGARLNQALIEEAQKSTPWLQGLKAKFDSRGYLSGVTLTPEQMHQMVGLAEQKDKIAWQKADSAARAMGVIGGRPQSLTGNSSTPSDPFSAFGGQAR